MVKELTSEEVNAALIERAVSKFLKRYHLPNVLEIDDCKQEAWLARLRKPIPRDIFQHLRESPWLQSEREIFQHLKWWLQSEYEQRNIKRKLGDLRWAKRSQKIRNEETQQQKERAKIGGIATYGFSMYKPFYMPKQTKWGKDEIKAWMKYLREGASRPKKMGGKGNSYRNKIPQSLVYEKGFSDKGYTVLDHKTCMRSEEYLPITWGEPAFQTQAMLDNECPYQRFQEDRHKFYLATESSVCWGGICYTCHWSFSLLGRLSNPRKTPPGKFSSVGESLSNSLPLSATEPPPCLWQALPQPKSFSPTSYSGKLVLVVDEFPEREPRHWRTWFASGPDVEDDRDAEDIDD